jgi:hypothetical protein
MEPARQSSMPRRLAVLVASRFDPIRMATPRMPSATPASLLALSLSSANRCAITRANNGVVALSTEASPLATVF